MAKISKIVSPDGYITERLAVHKNNLLGDYDQGGEYRISSKIIKELMQMRKVKKHTYNNSMFCVSDILGLDEILFEIHYEKKAVGKKATSEIFVLEDVYKVNGYFINTIKTKIGEFVSSVDNYLQKSYDYYNITLSNDDEGRDKLSDISGNQYPYTMAKKSYENAMLRTIGPDMERAYEKLYKEKLALIKGEKGDYYKTLDTNFDSEFKAVKDRFLTANGDNNFIAYNELLDKVIEDRDGVVEAEAEDTKKFYSELEKPIENLAKKYADVTMSAEKQVEKLLDKDVIAKATELKAEVIERNRFVKKSPVWDSGIKIKDIKPAEKVIVEKKEDTYKEITNISNNLKNIVRRQVTKPADMER